MRSVKELYYVVNDECGLHGRDKTYNDKKYLLRSAVSLSCLLFV